MARKVTYKRRPNNSGTVVKLSGKRRKPYCARILSNDRDLITGRKKQVTIGTFETELEALNALSLYHMTSNREITKNEAKELNNDLYNKIQSKRDNIPTFKEIFDILNEEEMGLLATFRPGLAQLEIGVQSTNIQTIHEIDRVMDFDMVTQKVQRVASAENIHQHLDLIAGLPYENLESFKKSFNDVYRLRPQQFQLGFLKVLKGSKMHEKAGEYGIVYHTRPMYEVLSTNWLTYDEVIYLKGIEEMVEVYYNSCQFRCTMRALEAEFNTPFAMYEALAEYYEENALNGLKHSRMRRFDILHDFILYYVKKEHAPKYEDNLLMDLYLREKSKSRPSWAADLSGYKSEIQEFFRKEAEEKRYLKDYEGYSWKQILNMTHVEVDSKGKWTLFDYKRRDPLTKDAKTYRILERKEEERA